MEEIDIWRTAKLLIDQHGEDAPTEAAIRADKALDDGLSDAVNIWMRVKRAVEDLQRQKPNASEPMN